MSTATITFDISDESAIQRAISTLQRIAGNVLPAPAPAAASGQRTAKAGAAPSPTAGASSPTAASAATPSQASTAATGDTGNGAAAAGPAAAATTASSAKPDAAPEVTFDSLKKAFISLSTKPNGRALCEGVLKPLSLGKLSEAKPEQYAQLMTAIEKASA